MKTICYNKTNFKRRGQFWVLRARRDVRFKVPQNIDMQDRILGPLTMIQFIYAVVGGAACYAVYMSAIPKPFSYVLIVPIALFVAAVIFIKVNERPFLNFLLSMFEFMGASKQRIWHHDESVVDLRVEVTHVAKQTGASNQAKHYTKEDIRRFANVLDKSNINPK